MSDPRLRMADQIRALEEATAGAKQTLARLAEVEKGQEHEKACHVCGAVIGKEKGAWPTTGI